MQIKFSTNKNSIKPSEAVALYVSVGWGEKRDYNLALMVKALQNSDFVISARVKEGDLVGLARVLTDQVFYTTVPDMVVNPSYQGKGIGSRMMKMIEQKYKGVPIFVETFRKNRVILKKFGFEEKSNMSVFSKKNAKRKNL